MKTWKIFLIWWGSIKDWETDFIELEILKSVNKKEINILMINFANSLWNDENYLEKFKKAYKRFPDFKINFYQILFSEINNEKVLDEKIKKSDIIYFWWWNTLQLKNNLPEKVFEKIIFENKNNSKILVWRSAWALIFFDKFLSEISFENPKIGLFDWFNIFSWILTVHFSEYWEEKELEKFVKEIKINWIWMDEWTCLIFENWKFRTIKKQWKNIYNYILEWDNVKILKL